MIWPARALDAKFPDPAAARFEIKFVAAAQHLDALRFCVTRLAAPLVPHHPDRWINSLYFDTNDYRCYEENVSGISQRRKLRYRWYGETAPLSDGCLELKSKRTGLGWKDRAKIMGGTLQAVRTWRNITAEIRHQAGPDARAWLEQYPLPILIVRYRRSYFESPDGRLRATIDRHIGYQDQRYGNGPEFRRPGVDMPHVVLELKFAPEEIGWVRSLVNDIPLRACRHSKYATGLRAIVDH